MALQDGEHGPGAGVESARIRRDPMKSGAMTGTNENSPPLSIGVTGTNGKTTTTTLVASILERVASPVARMTSLGAYIGERPWSPRRSGSNIAEFLNAARVKGSRFAALETTSIALAQGFARRWPSDVGVFTNLTR